MGEKRLRAERAATRGRHRQRIRLALPLTAALLVALAAVTARLYRERYPSSQRCPPEDDRFHDHCLEGRQHYLIEIDWACMGKQRAALMRRALDLPEDGKASRGIGKVPSWLTLENAEAVREAPCIRSLALDLACRYCKPTPKPKASKDKAAPSQEGGDEELDGDAST